MHAGLSRSPVSLNDCFPCGTSGVTRATSGAEQWRASSSDCHEHSTEYRHCFTLTAFLSQGSFPVAFLNNKFWPGAHMKELKLRYAPFGLDVEREEILVSNLIECNHGLNVKGDMLWLGPR